MSCGKCFAHPHGWEVVTLGAFGAIGTALLFSIRKKLKWCLCFLKHYKKCNCKKCHKLE